MSTSETRQGPGWWMDPAGGWKPPEQWPESTPPIPGWVRSSNGLWSEPHAVTPAPVADPSMLKVVIRNGEPVLDLRTKPKPTKPRGVPIKFVGGETIDPAAELPDKEPGKELVANLRFAETQSTPVHQEEDFVPDPEGPSIYTYIVIGLLIAGLIVFLLLL